MGDQKKGLGKLGSLSSLLNENKGREGVPMQLPVDDITPDPANIRNAASEQEEAERRDFIEKDLGPDVKERGVKSPISVRPNPDAPGKWLINFGENRWRASVWAEKTTVPAFVDEDFNDFDNAKENTKRLAVTGRQLARFIQRKEKDDKLTKKEIAQGLGISPSLVNQLSNLLKMPACIEEAYESGRLRDLTTIAELMTVYKAHKVEVERWMEEQADQEILRSAVKRLRAELDEPKSQNEPDARMREERGSAGSGTQDPHRDGSSDGESREGNSGTDRDPDTIDFLNGESDSSGKREDSSDFNEDNAGGPDSRNREEDGALNTDPEKFKRAIIQVQHDNRPARLILDRRPPAPGWAWVKYDDDGHEFETDLSAVQLVALVEG